MNASSAPAPTLPPAHLTMELYLQELALERRLAAEAAIDPDAKLREEIRLHNQRRSKLINVRTDIRKWTENAAPAIERGGVHFKVIGGKEVQDPFVEHAKRYQLASRFFDIPSAIKAPKSDKAKPDPRHSAGAIQARYKELRVVTCLSWQFMLEWITDLNLRIRIAKLVWWDLASYLKKDCVLEELVNTPLSIDKIKSYSEQDVAFELWRLGWPASMAAERAHHAQK